MTVYDIVYGLFYDSSLVYNLERVLKTVNLS